MMQIFKQRLLYRYALPGIMVLFLALVTTSVSAQQTQVSGTVKDDKGEPVASATVSVKGKNVSTTTGANGTFSIAAKANDVLEISAVSFTT
ncbi:MAG TPA: carboxypeptidase regulatory-like domain-containing protein, partial [Lacibacter sp.]|nr:carboxypeptidase regulatory-like domain-containing protein [Lacibacter sp.]